jgi:cytochrome c biogenesis protein CcmG/thiol:disulfide interchange protein DsbE
MGGHLRYLVPLAIFALLVAFLFRGLSLDPKLVPSPLVGKPVPKFTLTRLDNPATTLSDADFRGKVSLLNVWATWCVSCRREHETLVRLARTGKVEIYGLNYKDDRTDANRYLARLGNPYAANGFDGDGRVAIDWGVYGAPETFVIDREGIIRHKHIGPLTDKIIQDEILPLVAKLKS